MLGQSGLIFFYLLIGFIIFVTMKGELPSYAAIFGFGNG